MRNNNPKKYLIYCIHFPGFGRKLINLGNRAIVIYGTLIPTPMKKKIEIDTIECWVKAAVIAVPTKGAEHGVAKTVAKNPLKKSLEWELELLLIKLMRFTKLGIWNSNWLNKFIINKKIIEVIIIKKYGCWNCIPHEIGMFRLWRNKKINPSKIKDEIIPNDVIKKLERALLKSFVIIDINLIDKIGKTQGIIFKIKPPKKEIKR